jgi:hypothetical protein
MTAFFPPTNRAVCEKTWRNTVQPDRHSDNILPNVRFSSLINTARNTYSENVMLFAFALKQLSHEVDTMLHYTSIACIVVCTFSRKITHFHCCRHRTTMVTPVMAISLLYPQHIWALKCSRMCGCVTEWAFPDVSEKLQLTRNQQHITFYTRIPKEIAVLNPTLTLNLSSTLHSAI